MNLRTFANAAIKEQAPRKKRGARYRLLELYSEYCIFPYERLVFETDNFADIWTRQHFNEIMAGDVREGDLFIDSFGIAIALKKEKDFTGRHDDASHGFDYLTDWNADPSFVIRSEYPGIDKAQHWRPKDTTEVLPKWHDEGNELADDVQNLPNGHEVTKAIDDAVAGIESIELHAEAPIVDTVDGKSHTLSLAVSPLMRTTGGVLDSTLSGVAPLVAFNGSDATHSMRVAYSRGIGVKPAIIGAEPSLALNVNAPEPLGLVDNQDGSSTLSLHHGMGLATMVKPETGETMLGVKLKDGGGLVYDEYDGYALAVEFPPSPQPSKGGSLVEVIKGYFIQPIVPQQDIADSNTQVITPVVVNWSNYWESPDCSQYVVLDFSNNELRISRTSRDSIVAITGNMFAQYSRARFSCIPRLTVTSNDDVFTIEGALTAHGMNAPASSTEWPRIYQTCLIANDTRYLSESSGFYAFEDSKVLAQGLINPDGAGVSPFIQVFCYYTIKIFGIGTGDQR